MKMRMAICAASATVLLLACSKDKFQTRPTIELKDISNTEVAAPSGQANIRLEYTDKEGDLGNGQLTYIRIRTNGTPIPDPNTYDKVDTITTAIPDFPAKNKGEINLRLDYVFMDEDPNRNDTMYFKIIVKDIKNNISDTLITPSLVARQI